MFTFKNQNDDLLFLVNRVVVVGIVCASMGVRVLEGLVTTGTVALGSGYHHTSHSRWCKSTHASQSFLHYYSLYYNQ